MSDDNERGVYRKFDVLRTDGSSKPGGKHERCTYFVLDLEHDPFAVPALKAYAEACRKTHPELARDVRRIASAKPYGPRCGCREAVCPHTNIFGPGESPQEEMERLLERSRR